MVSEAGLKSTDPELTQGWDGRMGKSQKHRKELIGLGDYTNDDRKSRDNLKVVFCLP
jgi:hypothetical protein